VVNKKAICINWYDIRMVLNVILWQRVNSSRTLGHKKGKKYFSIKKIWDVHFILDECTMHK